MPPHVAAAVAKALEKLPADRFDSAKAFADALRNPAFSLAGRDGEDRRCHDAAPVGSRARSGGRDPADQCARPHGAGFAQVAPTSVARYPTTLGAPGALDGLTLGGRDGALTRRSRSLVFRSPLTGAGQLYIKRRDEVAARPLAGTEGGSGPFFSPDGAWIGFVANGQLRRIPSTGGASLKLADSVDSIFNRGAWLDDGSIVYYDVPIHALRRLRSGDATSKVIVSPAMLGRAIPVVAHAAAFLARRPVHGPSHAVRGARQLSSEPRVRVRRAPGYRSRARSTTRSVPGTCPPDTCCT